MKAARDELKRSGLIVYRREKEQATNESYVQKAMWRSLAVVFVDPRSVTAAEIHQARRKMKYFGDKFAVVLVEFIPSCAAGLEDFMRMRVDEFFEFIRGEKMFRDTCIFNFGRL